MNHPGWNNFEEMSSPSPSPPPSTPSAALQSSTAGARRDGNTNHANREFGQAGYAGLPLPRGQASAPEEYISPYPSVQAQVQQPQPQPVQLPPVAAVVQPDYKSPYQAILPPIQHLQLPQYYPPSVQQHQPPHALHPSLAHLSGILQFAAPNPQIPPPQPYIGNHFPQYAFPDVKLPPPPIIPQRASLYSQPSYVSNIPQAPVPPIVGNTPAYISPYLQAPAPPKVENTPQQTAPYQQQEVLPPPKFEPVPQDVLASAHSNMPSSVHGMVRRHVATIGENVRYLQENPPAPAYTRSPYLRLPPRTIAASPSNSVGGNGSIVGENRANGKENSTPKPYSSPYPRLVLGEVEPNRLVQKHKQAVAENAAPVAYRHSPYAATPGSAVRRDEPAVEKNSKDTQQDSSPSPSRSSHRTLSIRLNNRSVAASQNAPVVTESQGVAQHSPSPAQYNHSPYTNTPTKVLHNSASDCEHKSVVGEYQQSMLASPSPAPYNSPYSQAPTQSAAPSPFVQKSITALGEGIRAGTGIPPPIPYTSSPYSTALAQVGGVLNHLAQHRQVVGDNHRNAQQNPAPLPYNHSPYSNVQSQSIKHNSSVAGGPSNTHGQTAALATSPFSRFFGDRDEEASRPPHSGSNYSSDNETQPSRTLNPNMSTSDTTNGSSSASSGTIRQLAASAGMQLAPQNLHHSSRRGSRKRRKVNYADEDKVNEDSASDSDLSIITTNNYARKRSQHKNMTNTQDGVSSSEDVNMEMQSPTAPRRASASSRSTSARITGQKGKRSIRTEVPSSDADDEEDTEMNDVDTIRVDVHSDPALSDSRTPALTPDERRPSTSSTSSLSSLGEEPQLPPQQHPEFFDTTEPSIGDEDGEDEEEEEEKPRASRRATTIKKTAISALKPAPVRKPRPPRSRRVEVEEEDKNESSSDELSSSPPQRGFMPSPPRGAASKSYDYHQKKIMKHAEKAALLPQTKESRDALNKVLITRGKGIPLPMDEIMSMNYKIPAVFLPRGQNLDIPRSSTPEGRRMGSVLDTWIARENSQEFVNNRNHTDYLTNLQPRQQEQERDNRDFLEPKLSAKELAAKKAGIRLMEREADWEKDVAKKAEDGAYI